MPPHPPKPFSFFPRLRARVLDSLLRPSSHPATTEATTKSQVTRGIRPWVRFRFDKLLNSLQRNRAFPTPRHHNNLRVHSAQRLNRLNEAVTTFNRARKSRSTRAHFLARKFGRESRVVAWQRSRPFFEALVNGEKAAHLFQNQNQHLPSMSYARDIVASRASDGMIHCTSFFVQFRPASVFLKWLYGKPNPRQSVSPGGSPNAGPKSATLITTSTTTLGEEVLSSNSEGYQSSIPPIPPVEATGPVSVMSTPIGAVPDDQNHEDEVVHAYINGTLCELFQMRLEANGCCVFESTGTTEPSQEALQAAPLRLGANKIRLVYRNQLGDLTTEAYLFLWDANEKIIVSDIDGTITKSDVIGYIDTVQLGKYDYTHQGICELYTKLHKEGYHFVYLTSRPISMLEATRAFLTGCKQDDHSLPLGPIFTSTCGLTSVLYKELIDKSIKHFKADTLMDVADVFRRAGRETQVYSCGFGNKDADGHAYSAAGLHPDYIFIIDVFSDIKVFGVEGQGLNAGSGLWESLTERETGALTLKTYADPRLHGFLMSNMDQSKASQEASPQEGADGS